MYLYDKILQTENALLHFWQDGGKTFKRFNALGVKVVKTAQGEFVLVSQGKCCLFHTRFVVYGTCNKNVTEKDAAQILKDFCFSALKDGINQQSQFNFDVLVGYALPQEALKNKQFVGLLQQKLQQMKEAQQVLLAKASAETENVKTGKNLQQAKNPSAKTEELKNAKSSQHKTSLSAELKEVQTDTILQNAQDKMLSQKEAESVQKRFAPLFESIALAHDCATHLPNTAQEVENMFRNLDM